MMHGGSPLICANIAVVNNETASASHRYGYCKNGVSSLSARRTIQGRFCMFARQDPKILSTMLTTCYDVRTRNDTKLIVGNYIFKYC
jgi:hypothetical protein